jgi:hypothetical protein
VNAANNVLFQRIDVEPANRRDYVMSTPPFLSFAAICAYLRADSPANEAGKP